MNKQDKEIKKAARETGSVGKDISKARNGATGKIAAILRRASSDPVASKRMQQRLEDLRRIKGRVQQKIKVDSDLVLNHRKKKYFLAFMPKLLRADKQATADNRTGDVDYILGLYEGYGGLILEVNRSGVVEAEKGLFFNWDRKVPVSVLEE